MGVLRGTRRIRRCRVSWRSYRAAPRSLRHASLNLLIIVAVAAGIGIGAYIVGHAVDEPAKAARHRRLSVPAQAASATAQANLRAAVSAAASYRFDHGTYAGMTTSDLRSYDKGLASGVSVKKATESAYCVESTVAGATVSIRGPNGTFVARGC